MTINHFYNEGVLQVLAVFGCVRVWSAAVPRVPSRGLGRVVGVQLVMKYVTGHPRHSKNMLVSYR